MNREKQQDYSLDMCVCVVWPRKRSSSVVGQEEGKDRHRKKEGFTTYVFLFSQVVTRQATHTHTHTHSYIHIQFVTCCLYIVSYRKERITSVSNTYDDDDGREID